MIRKSRITGRILAIIMTVALVSASFSGCGGSDKKKDKDAYRQYGINCIENGNYDDAIEAFQKALDLEVGNVGDEEIDICFYKAKAQY